MYQLRIGEYHRFEPELSDYIPTRVQDICMGDIVLIDNKNAVVVELLYEFGIPKMGKVVDFKTRTFDPCRDTMNKIKTDNKKWTND